MAVHPFARKLEDAITKAKRLRDALKVAKDAPEGALDPKDDIPLTRITGQLGGDLGALFRGRSPVGIENGEATGLFEAIPTEPMARLLRDLHRAQVECAGVPSYVGRDDQGRPVLGPRVPNPAACTEAKNIREKMRRLIAQGKAYITRRTR